MAAALPAIVAAGCAAPGNFFGGAMSPVPRTTVSYTGREKPGTVIINTSERRLYLVLGNEQALRYGIGVGRVGFNWAGVTRVSAKKEWPDWTPPPQMLRREPDLPRFMKAVRIIRSAPAPCISDRLCSASTAQTSRKPSARPSPRDAFG
jgi:lipoprotein-anchoring transpeptidase ErfK/SrfK